MYFAKKFFAPSLYQNVKICQDRYGVGILKSLLRQRLNQLQEAGFVQEEDRDWLIGLQG